MAAALSMAAKTVECHLGRVYTKLGVSSRIQLAVAMGTGSRPNPDGRWPDLSPSEQHIAALVGVGMTTRLAAQYLFLSPKTVEYHLARIYRKLHITSRRQLLEEVELSPGHAVLESVDGLAGLMRADPREGASRRPEPASCRL